MSQVTGAPSESASQAKLLDAAVDAFAAHGFHGTTTRDIASAAGLSPAAVYVHHRSKEDLLHVISRRGHERTLLLVREALASAEEPTDQLQAFVSSFVAHHARHHTTARVVNYELSALTGEHLAEVVAVRRSIELVVRDLVERGAAVGAFDVPDPGMTTLALLSLGIDVARWYRDEGEWTPEQVADQYAALATRMVGARVTRSSRR